MARRFLFQTMVSVLNVAEPLFFEVPDRHVALVHTDHVAPFLVIFRQKQIPVHISDESMMPPNVIVPVQSEFNV